VRDEEGGGEGRGGEGEEGEIRSAKPSRDFF
jgi:hypothetical protein